MIASGDDSAARWAEAMQAVAIFAVDPVGNGGVSLRALAGPVRDLWLQALRELLPAATPLRRLPLQITDGRLLGGLDLAATLAAGRPVAERGLLAEADGGIVLAAMAERLSPGTAARLAAVLDTSVVAIERDGFASRLPAQIGLVLLDEGMADDERPPAALLDRVAFHLDLTRVGIGEAIDSARDRQDVAEARARLLHVTTAPELVEVLCTTATLLGIASLRAPLLALRVARAAAALEGRDEVSAADAALAGRLVLAPRATMLPAVDEPAEAPEAPPEPPAEGEPPAQSETHDTDITPDMAQALEDVVLEAALAAIPPDLLARLRLAGAGAARARTAGRAGLASLSTTRGRPAGIRVGEPGRGARLNLVATLRAAAPWQPLRRAAQSDRIAVRREDFRITRHKQRSQTTAIFVVDASGSAALHRLAEAKGAVELLLAECYVRRDRVALLAFRGSKAELLLAPTRSLTRARRSLAALPGGGGTPLAAGIDAALALADTIRRRGETPVLILLTDGRANIGRDGEPGRARAEADALAASRLVRAAGITSLLVDTSPQPRPQGGELALQMGAVYLPLPYADATALSRAVKASTAMGGTA